MITLLPEFGRFVVSREHVLYTERYNEEGDASSASLSRSAHEEPFPLVGALPAMAKQEPLCIRGKGYPYIPLIQALIALSVAKEANNALSEWAFCFFSRDRTPTDPSTCLCGSQAPEEAMVYTLKNPCTGKEVEIGECCSHYFPMLRALTKDTRRMPSRMGSPLPSDS